MLEPDAGWERGTGHAGVEDPRVTWVPSLGLHLMTYVAYGPLGPKPAQAVSADLVSWRRLGPLHFAYQPELDTDLNLFPNKDCVWFPEPVPGPSGPSYALLHRPMWDIGWIDPGRAHVPAGRGWTTSGRGSGSPTCRWPRWRPTSATWCGCATTGWWR